MPSSQFLSKHARQSQRAEFGRSIGGTFGEGLAARNREDIDEVRTAAARKQGQRGAGGEKQSSQVSFNIAPPIRQRGADKRFVSEYAGAVYQHVNTAETLADSAEDANHLFGLSDVGRDGLDLPCDLPRGPRQGFPVPSH